MTTLLIPRTTQDAQANLDAFITRKRAMGAWGKGESPFDDDAWPLEGVINKGVKGFLYYARRSYIPRLYYVGHGKASFIPADQLHPDLFRNFAKAMQVHLYLTRPTTGVKTRNTALEALFEALDESGTTDPSEVSTSVLDRTCEIILHEWRLESAPALLSQLEVIWQAMVSNELVIMPAYWTSPIQKSNTSDRIRLGPEFDALRVKKLPNPRAIEACAELFQRDDTDFCTTFVTSIVALMLCSPDRSVELLYSQADLLSPWTDPDTGEQGVSKRWRPAKGAPPLLKNVVPSMREIAVRAHERLHRLTEPGRELARWYEANPNRIYLPSHLEYLRHQTILNQREVRAILYGGEVRMLDKYHQEGHRVAKFLRDNHVQRLKKGVNSTVAFADIEQAILRHLPKGFPIMDAKSNMKYSEALCVIRNQEFAGYITGFMQPMLQTVTYSMIASALKVQSGARGKSIFAQHGYKDDQGEVLSLATHQMRHYLNTLVRREGILTEQEIAFWSGRKDESQNAVYDHVSVDDKLHKLEVRLGFHSDTHPFGNINDRIFIRRDQFGMLEKITAHLSFLGYCLHDYMQAPCQFHENCIQCAEMVCIKGDERTRSALEILYADSLALTEAARRDSDSEMLGAAEWFKVHSQREGFLKNLKDIFDSTEIQDGTPIRLNISTPNRIWDVMARRVIPIKPVSAGIKSMEEITSLLAVTPSGAKKEFPDDN